MDKKFNQIMFFAVFAIAFICLASMYYVETTGAFRWASSQSRDGYCRCITGQRTSGIEYSPYGGQGLEYKGMTTFNQCVNICEGRHSWRSR